MSLSIFHANRVEVLFEVLAERLAQVPDGMGALEAETVLLENPAMGAWLNLQLAQRHGIAAHIDYQRLSAFFWRVARSVLAGDIPEQTPLGKDELTWRLLGILGDDSLTARPALAPVKRYLEDGGDGAGLSALKQYQLAARVADLFDQYQVFRPRWIVDGWDRGDVAGSARPRRAGWREDEAWQRMLWREVQARAGENGHAHRARVHRRLCERLAGPGSLAGELPFRRLFVFGVTALPESDLDVLMGLSRHVDVDLFVFNPSAAYWCDIPTRRQAIREEAAAYRPAPARSSGPPEIGHPLLAAQAEQVRDFLKLVYDQAGAQGEAAGLEDFEAFVSPDRDRDGSLLGSIQQDILELRFRGEPATLAMDGGTPVPLPVGELEGPPSLHFHSCHGPLREVEVLRDQLLDLFERDPSLKPRDVVVMMPRVAPYAPYIHAVFADTGRAGRPRIDYHIADRTLVEEAPLLEAFDILLELPESRLALSAVLGLLEVPAVQRKFRLGRDGYETVRQWLVDSGVRWGLDAAHRQQEVGVGYRAFSWSFGLDRLMAGYAMRAGEGFDVLDVEPLDEVEGGRAAVLDGFLRFWQQLKRFRARLGEARTPGQWAKLLDELLEAFFDAEAEDQAALVELRRGLQTLVNAEEAGWHDGEISLAVVRAAVQPVLRQSSGRRHPWSEGVKFCSLLPMRGVPFRVVYLLGMNMEDYPRRIERPGFDLMRDDYRPGDRSARIDDRWLFLEALLSARQAFHVSYVGQDMHRNEPRQPSVVVSELQDCLREGYDTGAFSQDGVLQPGRWFTRHPLQPFSAAYFTDEDRVIQRCFSLDPDAYAVAQRQAGARRWPPALPADGDQLPVEAGDVRWQWSMSEQGQAAPVEGGVVDVELEDFIRFFARPSQWLFRRLGVSMARYDDQVDDQELLDPGTGLVKWQRFDALLRQVERDAPGLSGDRESDHDTVISRFIAAEQRRGAWPLGQAGDDARTALEKLSPDYLFFQAGAGDRQDLPVDLLLQPTGEAGLRVHGRVILHGGHLRYRSASKVSWKTLLDFYPRVALAACAGAGGGTLAGAAAAFRKDPASAPQRKVRLDKADWPVRFDARDLAEPARHEQFLVSLAALYLRYRSTGLPFEPGLSMAMNPDEPGDYFENVMNRWFDGDFGGRSAMRNDLRERSYFGDVKALLSPQFMDTSERVRSAVDQWLCGGAG